MKSQAHHIQALLADELNTYKGKENPQADNHIKKIQDVYKANYLYIEQLIIIDKRKQKKEKIQNKEVLLYKPYDISSKLSQLKVSKPTFIQDEINNLEKYIKFT